MLTIKIVCSSRQRKIKLCYN